MAARGSGRAVAVPAVAASLGATILGADHARASQGPGVADGTAEPITRATAAAMALVLPVTVAVFALARLLLGEERWRSSPAKALRAGVSRPASPRSRRRAAPGRP